MKNTDGGRGRYPLLLALFSGLVLGAVSAVLIPPWLSERVPSALQGGRSTEGRVLSKNLQGDRLLLKIETAQQGVLLATFTERTEEIDLLVDRNDRLTLRLTANQPFLMDPVIVRVQKPENLREPDSGLSEEAEPVVVESGKPGPDQVEPGDVTP